MVPSFRERQQEAEADIGEEQLPIVLDDVLGEGDGFEEIEVVPGIETSHEREQSRQDIDQREREV